MTEKIADSFELSPQQEQLWLAEPDGPKGAVQVVLALEGPLDADALASALRRVAERHEILRTIFVRQPGILVPVQAVAQQLPPKFATAQVTSDAELEQLATEQLGRPFDHAAGPPVRVVLAQRSEHDHALVLTISALCVDPGSATLLAREIVEHYSGLTPSIDDPLQYADFSAWQRELQSADSGEAASARDFWRDAAPVAPALPFA